MPVAEKPFFLEFESLRHATRRQNHAYPQIQQKCYQSATAKSKNDVPNPFPIIPRPLIGRAPRGLDTVSKPQGFRPTRITSQSGHGAVSKQNNLQRQVLRLPRFHPSRHFTYNTGIFRNPGRTHGSDPTNIEREIAFWVEREL